MKHILLFLFLAPIVSFSQCPPNGSFNSQDEIDTFAIDYPDCTSVGTLSISGDDITDLSGLYQITSCTNLSISGNLLLENTSGLNPNLVLSYVEGTGSYLGIINNASLTEVIGLENLVNQSGFESDVRIENNPMLTSIAGMPNSFSALDFLFIKNNDALISLEGIGNYGAGSLTVVEDNDALVDLTGWGYLYGGNVIIRNNALLQSLDGSENLGFDDVLIISDNPSLIDISAVYAGSYVDDGLVISNNPNLSVCSSVPVCYYITDNGINEGIWLPGHFENNAPGCNTNYEVEYGCGLVTNDDCLYNSPNGYGGNMLIMGETIQANNEYATTSTQAPSCNEVANRKDVWFLFDSGETTTIDITVDSGFNLQLWNSNTPDWPECGYQTQVAGGCGSSELLDINVTPNTFYFIQVWDNNSGRMASSTPGWFNLTVQDASLSNEEFAQDNVSLFPNPTTNQLTIQTDSSINDIKIFNVLGQQVYSLNPNINTTTIDTSTFNQGLYIVSIVIDGRESTFRIVKQ